MQCSSKLAAKLILEVGNVTGGAGVVAASALAQKARSLFGGREVASYDPSAAAAKKKEGNFFSRMLQSHIQETLAHEVSRTMSLLAAINEASRLRHGTTLLASLSLSLQRFRCTLPFSHLCCFSFVSPPFNVIGTEMGGDVMIDMENI
jgi:hypothetical protein